MATSSKPAELGKFLASIESIDRSSFSDEGDQHAALAAARALCARLERPWDTMINMAIIAPGAAVAVRTALEMGLFKAMDADKDAPQSAASLAKTVGADEVLVGRLLKHLAAVHLVEDAGANTYKATTFTSNVQNRNVGSAMDFLFELAWPTFHKLPEYLRSTAYKSPKNPMDGPWQYAMNTDTPFFGYLAAHPTVGANFGVTMGGFTADKQNWVEIFPTEQIVRDSSDQADDVLMVDVGGNDGADLVRFLNKHSTAKGRVVLQDQEHVLNMAKLDEGIRPMAHDFFTQQPVLGARAYFLHAVLHDWSDDDCVRILSALKPAFSKASRLLVCENVIPASVAHPQATALDLTMMGLLSAHERTEAQWKAVLQEAGFTVVKIHSGRIESVIEATLA